MPRLAPVSGGLGELPIRPSLSTNLAFRGEVTVPLIRVRFQKCARLREATVGGELGVPVAGVFDSAFLGAEINVG